MVVFGRLKASRRSESGIHMQLSLLTARKENNLEGVSTEVTKAKVEQWRREGEEIRRLQTQIIG